MGKSIVILGIESSCDDTAAAIIRNGEMLSNVVAGQAVHQSYGGVVPELASRAHQQNIIPVVDTALKNACVSMEELDAVAFTRGPGLMGSLLVGTSFAKAFSMGLHIPLIEVNHMQGHVLAHFIKTPGETFTAPAFPFLCLTVSGGHTQILLVKSHFEMTVLGETIDDAAGEAFDKAAKIMSLPYPGGPLIDKLAKLGNAEKFKFPKPHVAGLDFSFSGLKTGFMNFINNNLAQDPDFVEKNKADICASLQKTILDILMSKILQASAETGIRTIAVAGGVSANSGLRARLTELRSEGYEIFIPPFQYCTDNAAMIAIAGYHKFLRKEFTTQEVTPMPRYEIRNA